MKMNKPAALLSAMIATILLTFSVPVFAADRGGPTATTPCPPGYLHTAQGCGQRDVVEMKPAGTHVQLSPLCDQDSDCPNGMVCLSCNSARDILTDEECPPDKGYCLSQPKQ